MAYEKIFEKPYKNGWVNSPYKKTPITAEILNNYDAALEHIEKDLEKRNGVFLKCTFINTSTLKEFVVGLPGGSIANGFTWSPLSDYPAQGTKWNIEIKKPSEELIYTSIIAHWLGGGVVYLGSCDAEGNISWTEPK